MKIFFLALILVPVHDVLAIPPPDVILNILQSVMQTLGIMTLFIVSLLITSFQWTKTFYFKNKKHIKRSLFGLAVLLTIGVPLATLIMQAQWQKGVKEEMRPIIKQATTAAGRDEKTLRNILEKHEKVSLAESETNAAQNYLERGQAISINQFKELHQNPDLIILDIREKIAHEYGSIPGSIHFRLADFLFSGYKTLPTTLDTPIMVICYVSTSGSLVSEFLKSLGYENVYFLDKGLVYFWNQPINIPFEGELFFPRRVFDKKRFLKTIPPNITAIDVRSNKAAQESPIPNSEPLFWEMSTTPQINQFVQGLDLNKPYYIYCDSSLTCYSADIMWGHLKQNTKLNIQGVYRAKYTP